MGLIIQPGQGSFASVFEDRQIARGYDNQLRGRTARDTFAFRQYATRFANLLELKGSRKVWADVGCGPGHLGDDSADSGQYCSRGLAGSG